MGILWVLSNMHVLESSKGIPSKETMTFGEGEGNYSIRRVKVLIKND
jgi:hypothetical protein